MRDRQFGLMPRTKRRSRHTGKPLLGHHMRQGVPVFDARGEDMQGRIRAVILRKELRATVEPLVRMRMRDRLGREPTRRELRVVMAREYRAAKEAAKNANARATTH